METPHHVSVGSNSPKNGEKRYQNAPQKQGFLCFKQNPTWQSYPDRQILLNKPDVELCNNKVVTARYNAITFLPKNLFEQFSKTANIYFLIIGGLSMIGPISNSNGQPLILIPLIFVVLISMIKDFYEDLKRHKSDKEENKARVKVWRYNQWDEVFCEEILVGNIIKVTKDQNIPADILLLNSSERKGLAYVETKNLDGETNLKPRNAPKGILEDFANDKQIGQHHLEYNYEKPNPYLYQFNGSILNRKGEKFALDQVNFILRGSRLRNTDWIIGVASYTGHETKIMLNSVAARTKRSQVEILMNKFIVAIFIVQTISCMICAFIYLGEFTKMKEYLPYLVIDPTGDAYYAGYWNFFVGFGNWMLIFTQFVPISLLVTLEMVRFFQAFVIQKDEAMYTEATGEPLVQSSNLNEEIGQIHYVFSDKTGTLTANIMEFKKVSIAGVSYGDNRDYNPTPNGNEKIPRVTNVDFLDKRFFDIIEFGQGEQFNALFKALLFVSLCHTVICQPVQQEKVKENKENEERPILQEDSPESRPNTAAELEYNASSPDELALVNWAKLCGVEFMGIDDDNILTVKAFNNVLKYQLLQVLEFSSARKRMSVILKDLQTGKIFLMCKGADSVIQPKLANSPQNVHTKVAMKHLDEFGTIGLRTLMLAQREISQATYDDWSKRYLDAITSLGEKRAENIQRAQDEIEVEMALVGVTGVEDKLQDQVGETIHSLRQAGIRVWVLTGDKMETAINIGFSSQLLEESMDVIKVDGKSLEEVRKVIHLLYNRVIRNEAIELTTTDQAANRTSPELALAITGDALIFVMEDHQLSAQLVEIGERCKSVLACRVSPKQKEEIVSLVRKYRPAAITLGIGDGANDVNMIIAAHVGIGIRGVEGFQAARSSDYAFGEFRHLKRLLFVHGRECYRRNSITIFYNFFKNMVLTLPTFWFGTLSMMSGSSIFDPYPPQLFNLFYTALPIICFAIFDYEYDHEILQSQPYLYRQGMEGRLFNYSALLRSEMAGLIYSVLNVFICLYFTEANFYSPDGYNGFINLSGITVFTAAVVIANLRILIISHNYSFLVYFLCFGSILFYLLNIWIMGFVSFIDLKGIFLWEMNLSIMYFQMFLVLGTTVGIEWAFYRYQFFDELMLTFDEMLGDTSVKILPELKVFTVDSPKRKESATQFVTIANNNYTGPSVERVERIQ